MDLVARQQAWQEAQRKRDRSFNAAVAITAALVAGVMGIGGTVLGVFITKSTPDATPKAVAAPANPTKVK